MGSYTKDGTYVEVTASGKVSSSKSYPPLTHDPHDPSHYYQGQDGKYYYTPDGNAPDKNDKDVPEGRRLKETEPPDKYDIKKPDKNESWKHEADKGYKMHPDDLKDLAKKLRQDLNDLKYVIQQQAQQDMAGTGAMGTGYPAATDYDHLATSASTAFSQQWNAVISTYESVITLLTTTADNGQRGEDDTHHAVTNSGGKNKAI
ncbi:hypothetical protein GCM10023196_107230 [Actinoallomurus vinaceus]|uniref:Uncharacterized protein n=1 Tax=Actinoallomurus vinaceus TaxID=1080074 RepID=A0ABP8UX34_9ACTN